jgi:molybdenum cofactor cytidylyltransferase
MTAVATRVAALVLAAGRSTRMGRNKLLAEVAGAPLVTRPVDAALAAGLPVWVVTGHESEQVRAVLGGRDVRFAHNPDYASGIAGSLRAGVQAVGPGHAGVAILLGDMPYLRAQHIKQLVAAFEQADAGSICIPEHAGLRGNPVLWPACDFAALMALDGDTGGRVLLAQRRARVLRVAIEDDAVLIDLDTPEALRDAGKRS